MGAMRPRSTGGQNPEVCHSLTYSKASMPTPKCSRCTVVPELSWTGTTIYCNSVATVLVYTEV